jgi:exosortase/archaeosortase family protein
MQTVKRSIDILIKVLPILSFIIPFLILYIVYPKSFEATWTGRTFYIFFLWLASLEIVLNWEKLQTNKMNKLRSIRTVAFLTSLLLPTMYVVTANYYGLNAVIVDLAKKNEIPAANWTPLSTEYLVFAVFFAIIILQAYGIGGLVNFSISVLFLGNIGLIYTINYLYPNGKFLPFQFLVPTTASLAANVLNLIGYRTRWLGINDGMPTFIAWDSQGRSSPPFAIAWACAGIESLLLYTVTILLFLKKTPISWKHKIAYFTIGALVTYFINILRIVAIFVISINKGDWLTFHDFYAQLYSITWIVSYPLIIIGSQILWTKIRHIKTSGSDIPSCSDGSRSKV